MEYTKGKWEANLFTTFKGEVIYAIHAYPEATRIKRVAEVFEEANAQLIAKSPRMYELLKYLAENGWNASVTEEAQEIINELRAEGA